MSQGITNKVEELPDKPRFSVTLGRHGVVTIPAKNRQDLELGRGSEVIIEITHIVKKVAPSG